MYYVMLLTVSNDFYKTHENRELVAEELMSHLSAGQLWEGAVFR